MEERCGKAGCKSPPMLTYKGVPLCEGHWKENCREEEPKVIEGGFYVGNTPPTDGDERRPEPETSNEGSDEEMAKKNGKPKSTKKSAKPKSTKQPKAPKEPKAKKDSGAPKQLSALDAAAQVLKASKEPMAAKAIVEAMAEKGLWSSPGGKTPHATLYSSMMREEKNKGKESRFRLASRGLFEYCGD